jgi:hypothetical protein
MTVNFLTVPSIYLMRLDRYPVGILLDFFIKENEGARGSVVVKALCCKPEGLGFKSR